MKPVEKFLCVEYMPHVEFHLATFDVLRYRLDRMGREVSSLMKNHPEKYTDGDTLRLQVLVEVLRDE